MSVVSLLVMSLSVMWYNMEEEEEGRGGREEDIVSLSDVSV